jgi:hypothetical protein
MILVQLILFPILIFAPSCRSNTTREEDLISYDNPSSYAHCYLGFWTQFLSHLTQSLVHIDLTTAAVLIELDYTS